MTKTDTPPAGVDRWVRLVAGLAALDGFMAVAAGAFGAHAAADPAVRELLHTAAAYQLPGAAAALAALAWRRGGPPVAATLLAAGALLFGASLDLLAVTGAKLWGAVTPLGGLLLMAGWLAVGVAALRPEPARI